jgi:hypothetical protein
VEGGLGTTPHQAATWRPCLNTPPWPTAALSAVAVIGPTPGLVLSR